MGERVNDSNGALVTFNFHFSAAEEFYLFIEQRELIRAPSIAAYRIANATSRAFTAMKKIAIVIQNIQ